MDMWACCSWLPLRGYYGFLVSFFLNTEGRVKIIVVEKNKYIFFFPFPSHIQAEFVIFINDIILKYCTHLGDVTRRHMDGWDGSIG